MKKIAFVGLVFMCGCLGNKMVSRKINEDAAEVATTTVKSDLSELSSEYNIWEENLYRVPRKKIAKSYIVGSWRRDRECLWNIADKLYGNCWLWEEIYIVNHDRISDPDIIAEGMELRLPPRR